jgi:outer membrane protein assembly factor BamB
VLWTKQFLSSWLRDVQVLGGEIIAAFDGDHILGLDTAAVEVVWRTPIGDDVEAVLLNGENRQVYVANQSGVVTALALPKEEENGELGEPLPLWQLDLDVVGIPTLLSLPGGGLVLSTWDGLAALSAEGKLLWEGDMGARLYDWLVIGNALIISTYDSLWQADADGLQRWQSASGGLLTADRDNVLLYDGRSLFRLAPETSSVETLLALREGNLRASDGWLCPVVLWSLPI